MDRSVGLKEGCGVALPSHVVCETAQTVLDGAGVWVPRSARTLVPCRGCALTQNLFPQYTEAEHAEEAWVQAGWSLCMAYTVIKLSESLCHFLFLHFTVTAQQPPRYVSNFGIKYNIVHGLVGQPRRPS